MTQHIIRGRRLAETPAPVEIPLSPEWMRHPDRPCKNGYLWTSDDRKDLSDAAKLCRTWACPVLQECGRWAIENGERHHVWGGMNFGTGEMHSVVAEAKQSAPEPAVTAEDGATVKADLELMIREMWERGVPDIVIAVNAGCNPSKIGRIRAKLGLPTRRRTSARKKAVWAA
jgi:hypothetical protein